MPLHWRPVGPLPAPVYWRRRAVVLVALLLALWLLWRLLTGVLGGDDTLEPQARATPSASPTASTAASATPTPTPSATPEACADDVLEVQATAETADVPPGARTPFTLSVRNTGTAPCVRALGQGAVELVVTSGDDRVWSSDDCAPGGTVEQVVLAPGEASTARATWSGTRSAPGCPRDQPVAPAGTYRVTARVGELRVPGMVFRVTEG